jgi:transcriptional regulator with XRE-family HTH domain
VTERERRDGVALPFYHLSLRRRKLRAGYPESPSTLGEHLKKRRLDLGLMQREVASRLGIHLATYRNWEEERHEPEARFFGGLVAFLGYDPEAPPPTSPLGERIKAARRRQGLSQEELACHLGLDQKTIWAWETGRVKRPYPRLLRLFEEFVKGV